jgi:GTP-binding protein LepA
MRGCQGALLLVDVTQGIQAQTLANYELAKKENLKIIGILNKIDAICDIPIMEK